MSDGKQTLKQRAVHGVREYLVISAYLFGVFSLLVVHKSMILAEHHIDYKLHGVALFNALALAKVMVTVQELHFADPFKDAPLIYPTLAKSFAFTIVFACFKIAEDAFVGRLHGKSFHESISDLGGGSWKGILTLAALMFFVLVPFFGFSELRRVFGADRLVSAFFRPRHLLNLPTTRK